jgi:hypothetical protein
MTEGQSQLLGQVLKVYLNHALECTTVMLARLTSTKYPSGHVPTVLHDGNKLKRYIRSTLDTAETILCSVKGVTALVAIGRAEQALSCAIESAQSFRPSSADAKSAATLLRKSANLAVNMLLADYRGETELAETWNVARGLLDAVLYAGVGTGSSLGHASSLSLPCRPVHVPGDLSVWLYMV